MSEKQFSPEQPDIEKETVATLRTFFVEGNESKREAAVDAMRLWASQAEQKVKDGRMTPIQFNLKTAEIYLKGGYDDGAKSSCQDAQALADQEGLGKTSDEMMKITEMWHRIYAAETPSPDERGSVASPESYDETLGKLVEVVTTAPNRQELQRLIEARLTPVDMEAIGGSASKLITDSYLSSALSTRDAVGIGIETIGLEWGTDKTTTNLIMAFFVKNGIFEMLPDERLPEGRLKDGSLKPQENSYKLTSPNIYDHMLRLKNISL